MSNVNSRKKWSTQGPHKLGVRVLLYLVCTFMEHTTQRTQAYLVHNYHTWLVSSCKQHQARRAEGGKQECGVPAHRPACTYTPAHVSCPLTVQTPQ